MADVTRSGPPTTKNGREWSVPLSERPNGEWVELFRSPKVFGSIARPDAIVFPRAELAFPSDEHHVPEWIGYIDGWIADANERLRALQADRARQRQKTEQAADAERDRIQTLNEKFKNL